MSSSVTFASRASSSSRRSSGTNTGTVKYGTLLSSGATASYPTSFASSPQYNPASASNSGGSKLSGGTIAGIVVACVAFVFLVIFLVVLFIMRRRKANKRKRESRTALLPPPPNSNAGVNGQPEMAQYPNYASTGTGVSGNGNTATTTASNMPAPPAAVAASSHTSRKNVMQSIPGLSFGSASGHRRTDSNNSTTPFLAGAIPDSPSRPSTASGSPHSNRYSMESTTTYTGSPTMPHQNRFSNSHFGSTGNP